ncbi:MAG: hypothetical protein ACFCU1_02455 [Sumerlaeia bacterium]
MNKKNLTLALIGGCVILLLLIVFVFRNTAEPVVATEPVTAQAELVEVQNTPPTVIEQPAPPAEQNPVVEEIAEIVEVVEEVIAPEPVAVAATTLPPTVLKVVVIEDTTGMKLMNVDLELVAIADGSTNPFENEPQDFPNIDPANRPQLSPLEAVTNIEGVAVMTIADADLKPLLGKPMGLVADWGVGPRHEVSVQLKMNQNNELEINYPGRSEINLHLKREDDSPVTNFPVTIDVRQFDWSQPGGFFLPQELKTNSDGNAVFLSYPQTRTPIQFRTDEIALFKGIGRRSTDGNPMFAFGNIDPEETIEVTVVEDVVLAIGTLRNVPETLENITMTATVEGEGVNYFTLPVTDKQVKFSAPVDKNLKLYLLQAEDDGDIRRRFQGPPPSVELKMDVQLPEQPGIFRFDMEFAERSEVIAKVYLPNGDAAEGVRVRGLGFGESVEASTGTGGRNNWQARIGRISGESSIRSQPTNSTGVTIIDVPPASYYLFQVDSDTLPEEARGVETIELAWNELEKGAEIVFNLKPSSLLWGTVLDRNGTAVAGADVYLRGPDIPWNDPLFRTRTVEDGTFELNVPPTRLSAPDPNEPPDYYVFSSARNIGGGLGKAVIDNPEEAVAITLQPFKSFRVEVLKNGAPVTRVDYAQLYDVPGFDLPIRSRDRGQDNDDNGVYRFRFLIEEVSSLNIWESETDSLEFVTIPINAQIVNNGRYRVDLADPSSFALVEEEANQNSENNGNNGPPRNRGGG